MRRCRRTTLSRLAIGRHFPAVCALSLSAVCGAQEGSSGDGSSAATTLRDIPHVQAEFLVDGMLDDAIWSEALMIELEHETNPGENVPAPVRTIAYLAEDGSHLLVAFDARDPNTDAIRAYLRDRDTAYNDDFVGVVLDTFGDERRGFEFFVNPLGVQMDLTNDDINRREDDSWDAIWESAGMINGHGYVVEMAIPFSQLRFPRAEGEQIWGIDVLRFYPREDRSRLSINPLDRGRNCYLCQLSKVRGFANAEPGEDLEIVPSVTAFRNDERDVLAGGPMIAGDSSEELGVNVRWGITPDLTANLALNPDFSQVEADVPQLDVNNQFSLFFPETRPFFLEGQDFFTTPINAVFSRTVADPDVGTKLTGRLGDNTIGVFAAEDAITNLLFPGALGSRTDSLDQSNQAFVGRYSRGFGQASSVGVLVTSRSGDRYDNAVAGFDGRYRMNDRHSIRFQYLSSETEYPDAIVTSFEQPSGPFTGDARSLRYDFSTRNWFANVRHESLAPGFRADSGFVRRVGVEEEGAQLGRIWHGDERDWWNQFRVGGNWSSTYDHDGQLLDRGFTLFTTLQGPMQSFVQTGFNTGQQFWDGQLFDTGNFFVFGQVRPLSGLSFNIGMNRGDQIDFSNSRLADRFRIEPGIDWNVNRHLLLRLQHTISKLDSKEGPNIFEAELSDLRITWQFNLRSFLRLTVQRQFIERNQAMYVDPDVDARSLTVGSQLVYSYKINPQTVFFLGYSDNQLEDDQVTDLMRTDRTFFLKFSYAWIP